MTHKTKAFAAFAYGAIAPCIGLWRLLLNPGKTTGLYFGLAIGAIGAIAGALLLLRKRLAGIVLCFAAVGFGGGFFVHRLVTGGAEGDYLRVGMAIAAALATAIVLLVPAPTSE